MLLPVLNLDLIPHDHVEINAQDFMRTLPMNTAAFASMRGVYEFFFVPYHQLWAQFDQFITGMNDFHSSANKSIQGGTSPLQVPYFNLESVFKNIIERDSTPSFQDDLQYRFKYGAFRLLDLLGYGRKFDSFGTAYPDNVSGLKNNLDYNCSVFRVLAYNKIYQDYYRNSNYENFDTDSFNFDKFKGGLVDAKVVADLFKLRYRNAQTDYFTNLRQSQLFTFIPEFSDDEHLNFDRDQYADQSKSNFTQLNFPVDVDNNLGYFSVSSLRSAFAVDKLLSVTMRAGKTFQDQMRAHYGVEIPDSRDGRVNYLGGFDSDLQVSDVTQTSGTTATEYKPEAGYLGRIAGKGTGSGRGRIVFDAKEHGVLMCIYSLVPQIQYDCTRLDPMVDKLDRFDFFTPEFENLGMQPLNSSYISSFCTPDPKNPVLGYQPRYSEYKTALDINHGQFAQNDALSSWSVSRFRRWTTFPQLEIADFKIDPGCLNSVFPVEFNGTESTDCVFGGCNFNIVKVSDMSVDGMPRV
ncbi:putative capsid protein (F protein) [Hallella bergensis DSM 17361]|uniref:Putative capsid protein (F protein) n=2 Tax=Hallella bergensis TaxID=242750 RepID=D1PVF0_9BACT|nr:putative capsid protein (F protein) [Hallella bergensis DSM 17361]